jgi:aminomethyltransferase
MPADAEAGTLLHTPLAALHRELGAQIVPFAGWAMPLRYPAGVLEEHRHTRSAASLFDVSHMGQIWVRGADPAVALEQLVPADLIGLAPGRQRYALLTDEAGFILDDLMVARLDDALLVVANAANAEADLAWMRARLPGIAIERAARALLALQGPAAEAVLADLAPAARTMRFLDVQRLELDGADAIVARSGYTGEDGFEISVPEDAALPLARRLLGDPRVRPAGLGARDSLRLEAGLCLHGQDIGPGVTPGEAGLGWSIGRARRSGGARAGGFPGAARILPEIEFGAARRRVGLRAEGRAPVRAGAALFAPGRSEPVGHVTSGGFGPSVQAPIAMGFVPAALAEPGTIVEAERRGGRERMAVTALPFVPPGFRR